MGTTSMVHSVYGDMVPMVLSPLEFVHHLRDQGQGNVLYMGENEAAGFYQVWKPEHARYVLQENEKNYTREPTGARFSPLSMHRSASHEHVIVGIDGDGWRAKRKSLRASFTRRQAGDFFDLADTCYSDLQGGNPLARGNTSFQCFELMFAAILRYTLSLRVEKIVAQGVWRALPGINRYFHNGLFTTRTIMNGGYARDFSFCRDFFRQALEERVAFEAEGNSQGPDLFARVAQKVDLSDPDQLDRLGTDLLSISLAGADAPSLALAWTLYAIAANPEVRRRLEEEVDVVLGDRSPTQADLENLGYTQAVVRESLRLYPPAWYTPRTSVEDDSIEGVRIPAGSHVVILQYLMHRDPQHWDEPDRFRPERFLDSKDHPAYMPYGWGPRYCFAADYAHVLMTAFTALIVRDHRIALRSPEPPRMEPLINLRMKQDLHLAMMPR